MLDTQSSAAQNSSMRWRVPFTGMAKVELRGGIEQQNHAVEFAFPASPRAPGESDETSRGCGTARRFHPR